MIRKLLVGLCAAFALLSVVAPPAGAAVTVATTATFYGAEKEDGPDAALISYCGGLGQSPCTQDEPVQVRWGSGAAVQSRLGFRPLGGATLGQPFSVGRLTHHNTTINLTAGIVRVRLAVTTHVDDGARSVAFTQPIELELGVNEIIDAQRPCPYGANSSGQCSDAILLPAPHRVEDHAFGNVVYRLEIQGFGTPGALAPRLVTGEGGTTTTDLIAVVTRIPRVVADSGPDQTVDEGTTVTLDGSASRVEGLTYLWEQTAGPAVALDDENAVRPTFPVGLFTEDQVLEFRLTVRDAIEPDLSSTDTVRIAVRDLNDPPVASAGGPYTVPEGGSVVLDATATDPDGNIGTVSWDFDGDGDFDDALGASPTFSAAGLDGPSVVPAVVQVCDTFDVCATGAADVHVVNVAPTVDVGPDLTVYRNDVVTAVGTFLDPAGSLDDPYDYTWSGGAGGTAAYGDTLESTVSYGLEGVYAIDLDVTDKDGGSGRDSLQVTVLNRAPSCVTAAPTVATLWPPNHGPVAVGITGITDAEGDTVTTTVTSIRQDEAVDETGSGNTGPDAWGVGTATAQLLAERSGRGDGRVYHLAFTADDGHGGSCSGVVTVGVPHDQRGSAPVDQGALHDSTVA